MVRSFLFDFFIGYIVLTASCFAQGETAVPFLLISPSAEANGMGETSVAILTDDPLAPMTNPAQLGMLSLENYFSYGYNFSNWLPDFNLNNLWYKTFAFNTGVNLRKLSPNAPDLAIGLGYSRIYLNLGEFVETGPTGPTPIGTFNADETSDQYTLGIGLNSWVKASAGATFKQIISSLAPFNVERTGRPGIARVNSYDLGLFLRVPLMEVLSRLREKPIEVSPHLSPFLDFNIGFAQNNLGNEKVIYIDTSQADPLPRYARVGIGLNLGIVYKRDDIVWKPFSFKWTIEANDLLVRRYGDVVDSSGNVLTPGHWEYRGGLGDIDFFNEVILGRTNTETIKKKGWEVGLLDFIFVRGGRFEEDYNRGNRRFSTSGYSVQFGGLVRLLRAAGLPLTSDTVVGYIVNHLDVRISRSTYSTDEWDNPLASTEFNSVNILVSN